jgi:hypothetical protein
MHLFFHYRHEAGLVSFHEIIESKDLWTENLKENAVGKLIEAEEQKFPPKEQGTTREYHSQTRGMILNEIFRRVEPQGWTEIYAIKQCSRPKTNHLIKSGDAFTQTLLRVVP